MQVVSAFLISLSTTMSLLNSLNKVQTSSVGIGFTSETKLRASHINGLHRGTLLEKSTGKGRKE